MCETTKEHLKAPFPEDQGITKHMQAQNGRKHKSRDGARSFKRRGETVKAVECMILEVRGVVMIEAALLWFRNNLIDNYYYRPHLLAIWIVASALLRRQVTSEQALLKLDLPDINMLTPGLTTDIPAVTSRTPSYTAEFGEFEGFPYILK
ncbi:hypothetical protein KXV57_003460, partial [Aspergillus fumigatus]